MGDDRRDAAGPRADGTPRGPSRTCGSGSRGRPSARRRASARDGLKAAGYRLGCVTNKAAQFTIPLLQDLGVYDEFELVISGDTLAKKKPDPLPLLHAAQHFGVEPANALMIGDSQSDVKAARAAGFQIVCMSYGYNHGEDIRDYHPDAVVDSMLEINGLLEAAA